MDKYIDADELIKTLNREGVPFNEDVNYFILHAPAADVQEVRHGQWTREVLGSTSGYGTTVMYQCSACESMAISKYHYCPNCGALLRGEQE